MKQKNISPRQQEIADQYISALDRHIQELKNGTAERTKEIGDLAAELHIHPVHLSNTLHHVLGQSPCSLYEERLMHIARELIRDSGLSIAAIARHLDYDPSNFSKFFSQYEGMTPGQYRKKISAAKSEVFTTTG